MWAKKHSTLLLLILGSVVIGVGALLFPRPALAQCGSSVSSCKNCHEVQGKDSVNAKGAWHTDHAFGDFCEFCHGGNVKGVDEASAHVGLVNPLADVKTSCQSCHANNYMTLAQQYATTLGQPLGTGSTPGPTPAASGGTPTAAGAAPCGPAAPTSGQLIDLNKIYADTGKPPAPNIGNWILSALIGATLLVLLGLVWHYDNPLPRLAALVRQILVTPVLTATTPEGIQMNLPVEFSGRPEFSALNRALASSDPATVRAVTQLLADRESGPKILRALSHMDLQTLASLGENDQKALASLLALMKEMKA